MRRLQLGFGLATLGTILAPLAFLPVFRQIVLPIPILVGGLLYLGGGLMVAAHPPAPERQVMIKRLRILRIIFALVVAGFLIQFMEQF